jgi:hypothetical protein
MMQKQVIQGKQTILQKATQQAEKPQLSGLKPEHPYLSAQGIFGNHGVLRRHGSDVIQAKLTIGSPNGKYEQEADRMADQIVRMSKTRAQQPMKEISQPKGVPAQSVSVSPHLEARIDAIRGNGQPLSESIRAFFEARFGYDFGQVRIHTNRRAAETAQMLKARAFVVGRDLVFGAGKYKPETPTGQRLLAHELTHVVQQSPGASRARILSPQSEERENLNLNLGQRLNLVISIVSDPRTRCFLQKLSEGGDSTYITRESGILVTIVDSVSKDQMSIDDARGLLRDKVGVTDAMDEVNGQHKLNRNDQDFAQAMEDLSNRIREAVADIADMQRPSVLWIQKGWGVLDEWLKERFDNPTTILSCYKDCYIP